MHAAPLPCVDPEVPVLLRQLLQQVQAGDLPGQRATTDALGAVRRDAPATLVGALCLGGADFAARLVSLGHDGLDAESCLGRVLQAFSAIVDPASAAAADHEQRVAAWLVDSFGLQHPARSLLDVARAEFLIAAGPLEEVPEAALAAMRHARWELALRGFERLRQTLTARTPRNAYGMAAMCLHKLGRYEEAERWAQDGLGPQAALLAIAPVWSEAELLHRWSGRAAPVVSIICTTYNHERYIESAIRGFLSQDCGLPFEILIHDDASTDGTQQIIRRWQQRYPKLIKPLLQTENQFSQGVRPFELMLARARGEFVAVCEGDDFWTDPAKLRKQVGFLQARPEFSCSAHNYHHYLETALTVKPWTRVGKDFVLSQRDLMRVSCVLWLPTLVFRKTFSSLPSERGLAAIGDQFLTSFLGTRGPCAYFETWHAAVRRENEFSLWSPLTSLQKERMRVKTWAALVRMHERMGHPQAVADLTAKISASTLDGSIKASILDAVSSPAPSLLAAA